MQSLMVNISAQDLDTAVNLITNDNLDLGCAVIEKAATEKVLDPFLMHLSFFLETMVVFVDPNY